MKANFTSNFRTTLKALGLISIALVCGNSVKAQTPFQFIGGMTYYVDSVGIDLVAPKDTFISLMGTGALYNTTGAAYTTQTGVLPALTYNGSNFSTLGTINIVLCPRYSGFKEVYPLALGNSATGGYPYQSSNRPVVVSPTPGYNFIITTLNAITGNSSLFRLYGVQFFTVDGQGTAGQRNIIFQMHPGSTSTFTRIIDMIPMSSSLNQNITIKNCELKGNSTTSNIYTLFGIYSGGLSNGSAVPAYRSQNITIQNNYIKSVMIGVMAVGMSNAGTWGQQDFGLVVKGNIIGGTIAPGGAQATDFIGGSTAPNTTSTNNSGGGIIITAQANAQIDSNTIRNCMTNSNNFRGIGLHFEAGYNSLDSSVSITRNRIYNLTCVNASVGVYGIRLNGGIHQQPLALYIANNTIANVASPGNSSTVLTPANGYACGITVEDNSNNVGVSIIHNTINMYGSVLTFGAYSACLATGQNTGGGIQLINNIFSNRMGRTLANITGSFTYGIISNYTPSLITPFTVCDGNNYFVNTTDGSNAYLGYAYTPTFATTPYNYVSINHWRIFTGQDANSRTAIPPFLTDTFCELDNSTSSVISNAGITTFVGTDINGNTRPSTLPSIGAYQFTSTATSISAALVGGATYPINSIKNWPTAGSPGSGSFANLTEAVTYLNAYGVSGAGNVKFELQSSTSATPYLGEGNNYIPAIIDYPNLNGGRPVYITVANGANDTVSVPNNPGFNNMAVMRFIGARFVTIDGLNQYLTFYMPPLATNTTAKVLALTPSRFSPTTDIQILNCVITGNSTTLVNNTFAGIYLGRPDNQYGAASALSGLNNNHSFAYNVIQAVQNGIYYRGNSVAGMQDQAVYIGYNTIGGTIAPGGTLPTTYIGGQGQQRSGLYLKGLAYSTIDNNIIRNCINNNASYYDFRGIDMNDGNTANPSQSQASEAGRDTVLYVSNNRIYNLATGNTSLYGNIGIRINLGPDTIRQITLVNNFIGKILGPGIFSPYSLQMPTGIQIDATAVNKNLGVQMYYNTIQLSGSTLANNTNNTGACLYIGGNVQGGLKVQDNIFSNKLGTTGTPNTSAYCVVTGSNTLNPFKGPYPVSNGLSDNNIYNSGGNNSYFYIGYTGGINIGSLGNLATNNTWRYFTKQDSASYFYNVQFISDTLPDVVVQTAGPVTTGGAVPSVPITKDIYGTIRYGSFGYYLSPPNPGPCIGAVEFSQGYSPLSGGTTYYINGIQNPPLKSNPTVGSFATVNRAIQFINANGVNGFSAPAAPITLLITTGYIGEGDTLISPLTNYPNMNANRRIILKTDSVRTLTTAGGTNAPYVANGSVIRFNGGSFFTIDGSINGTNSRDLTITLPAATGTNATLKVIDFVPGTVSSTDVIIKNCNIIGNSNTSSINTYAGIYSGGVTATPSNPVLKGTNNNQFINNFIGAVKYGIYLRGLSTTGTGLDRDQQDRNNVIRYNFIGGDVPTGGANPTDYWGGLINAAGIFLSAQSGAVVDSNVIKHCMPTVTAQRGIEVSNASGTNSCDSNIMITRNIIRNMRTTLPSIYGIYINLGGDSMRLITITNNWIAGLSATGQTSTPSISALNPIGILVDGTSNTFNLGLNIWFNSINFGSSSVGTTPIYAASSCVTFKNPIKGGVSLMNNILQNRQNNAQATSGNYAVVVEANQSIFSNINSNDYFCQTTNGNNVLMAYNAFISAVNLNNLNAIAAFTKQDTTSINFVVNSFVSDTVLDIPISTSSTLFNSATYNNTVLYDIFNNGRPYPNPTIGAVEIINGSFADSVSPKIYNYSDIQCGNGPFSIDTRVYFANNLSSDTLYYTVNGGTTQIAFASTVIGNRRIYIIPAQAQNSMILYRISVNDNFGHNGIYPATGGWDTISTTLSLFPYGYGFDGPNTNRWTVEQVSGNGGWMLGVPGSLSNPNYTTCYGGVKMALFSSANQQTVLPVNTRSRIVSPCFDLSTTTLPTLRFWMVQNATLPSQRDSIIVYISTSLGGGWIPVGATVNRVNTGLIAPQWQQVDVCLAAYSGFTIKVGIEAISRGGNNIMIDSIMMIDNNINSTMTPLTNTICGYDSLAVTLSNSAMGVTYQMYDALTMTPLSSVYNGNGGNLSVKAPNPNKDSAWVVIWATNTLSQTSGCANFMHDTAKFTIKRFKNGPFLSMGIPFSGNFNVSLSPIVSDAAKVGDTLTYNIVPPSGLTNADYGTKWTITTNPPTVKTVIGVPAFNVVYTAPTSTSGGFIRMFVSTQDADSTFFLNMNIRLLPSLCDSMVVRKIKVTSLPLTAFVNGGRDTACRHAVTYFQDLTPFNPLTAPYTYSWDFGDSTFETTSSVNKVYNTPGVYIVKHTVTNNFGLSNTVTKTFTVLPSPSASYSNSKPCSGDSILFTNTTTGGSSYRWTYLSAFTPINTGSSTQQNPHLFLPTPGGDTGTYNVTLIASNTLGCTDTAFHLVQLFAKPQAAFTTNNLCMGSLVSITNTSTIAGANNSIGCTWNTGSGKTYLSFNPTFRYDTSGTFALKLIVTSNYGCVDSVSRTITVYDKPKSGFIYDTTTSCTGVSVNFTNNSTYSGGNNKILYFWNFGDQNSSTDAVPVKQFGKPGLDTITLYATDTIHYCTDSIVKIVNISETPIAQFDAPTGGCTGAPVSFSNKTAFTSGMTVYYFWKFGDGAIDNATNPSHAYTSVGTDTITLRSMALSGCFSTATKYINISSSPVVSYTSGKGDSINCYTVRIVATVPGLASYKWTIWDSLSVTTLTNYRDTVHSFFFSNKGLHKVALTVTDQNGCIGYKIDSTIVRTWCTVGINEVVSPSEFGLNIYPNPFNESTNISYELYQPSNVHIVVFDLLGRTVADVNNGMQTTGKHTTTIDAENFSGASSVYLVRIQIGDQVISRQILKQK